MNIDDFAQQLQAYGKLHWGADHLPDAWRQYDFAAVLPRVLADITAGVTREREYIRIAGQSGSGKTTQLLPAAKAYFAARNLNPAIVAARLFGKYHPFYQEILEKVGPANIRESTDEFTIMLMFLVFKALVEGGYDIILDVSLLDPFIEGVLMKFLTAGGYKTQLLMIAISKELSDQQILKRKHRVVKNTAAAEFWRTTNEALGFYATSFPDMRVTAWSAWELQPIYEGDINAALAPIRKYQEIASFPGNYPSEEELREAKINTLIAAAGSA